MRKVEKEKLDIIIPVSMDPMWKSVDDVVRDIQSQHEEYGFVKYALLAPSKGWRGKKYPSSEHYVQLARMFAEIKEQLRGTGIQCGWCIYTTVKSGTYSESSRAIKSDGSGHPFANCPIDPMFRKRFMDDLEKFVEIARPEFILLEDDYSMKAMNGCFCERHLNAFAKRKGRYYTREELNHDFMNDNEESYQLLREWRQLMKDTLVEFAKEMRERVDKVDPSIPIGYCQPGSADYDGDSTEAISKALAGKQHTPFARLFGTFYCGVNAKEMPGALYHMLYCKQHIKGDFAFYHESDIYPHNKFYAAERHLKALMSVSCAFGFDGMLLWTSDVYGNIRNESGYGNMVKQEYARFDVVSRIGKKGVVKGVQVAYDPFWNTVCTEVSTVIPLWATVLGRFGISYTSSDASIAFWDARQARYATHEQIMERLRKGLFLDGEAARKLCLRGYGKYLGVEVGEDLAQDVALSYDLGAREVICEVFTESVDECIMPPAHGFCPAGAGKSLRLQVTDISCEVLTEIYTFEKEYVAPGMTRFQNELGGKVVVMGLTLDGNQSQSLYNYSRRRLLQRLIRWCDEDIVMAENAPDVFVICNEIREDGLQCMITVINLCEDKAEDLELYLPNSWKEVGGFFMLDMEGDWTILPYERTENGICIKMGIEYCEPVYILARK